MKRFISGFLLGALIFAVPAIANNAKTIEAFYNNIKLSVYGQIVDTQGNEPFIVEGRTYVPARFVAEAMGGVVKWNETENTVEVTRQTPETTATPEPTKLTSDGLEAELSYTSDGTPQYLILLSKAMYKNNLKFDVLNPDNKEISARIYLSSKYIDVPLHANNAVYIEINDYENILNEITN